MGSLSPGENSYLKLLKENQVLLIKIQQKLQKFPGNRKFGIVEQFSVNLNASSNRKRNSSQIWDGCSGNRLPPPKKSRLQNEILQNGDIFEDKVFELQAIGISFSSLWKLNSLFHQNGCLQKEHADDPGNRHSSTKKSSFHLDLWNHDPFLLQRSDKRYSNNSSIKKHQSLILEDGFDNRQSSSKKPRIQTEPLDQDPFLAKKINTVGPEETSGAQLLICSWIVEIGSTDMATLMFFSHKFEICLLAIILMVTSLESLGCMSNSCNLLIVFSQFWFGEDGKAESSLEGNLRDKNSHATTIGLEAGKRKVKKGKQGFPIYGSEEFISDSSYTISGIGFGVSFSLFVASLMASEVKLKEISAINRSQPTVSVFLKSEKNWRMVLLLRTFILLPLLLEMDEAGRSFNLVNLNDFSSIGKYQIIFACLTETRLLLFGAIFLLISIPKALFSPIPTTYKNVFWGRNFYNQIETLFGTRLYVLISLILGYQIRAFEPNSLFCITTILIQRNLGYQIRAFGPKGSSKDDESRNPAEFILCGQSKRVELGKTKKILKETTPPVFLQSLLLPWCLFLSWTLFLITKLPFKIIMGIKLSIYETSTQDGLNYLVWRTEADLFQKLNKFLWWLLLKTVLEVCLGKVAMVYDILDNPNQSLFSVFQIIIMLNKDELWKQNPMLSNSLPCGHHDLFRKNLSPHSSDSLMEKSPKSFSTPTLDTDGKFNINNPELEYQITFYFAEKEPDQEPWKSFIVYQRGKRKLFDGQEVIKKSTPTAFLTSSIINCQLNRRKASELKDIPTSEVIENLNSERNLEETGIRTISPTVNQELPGMDSSKTDLNKFVLIGQCKIFLNRGDGDDRTPADK